MAERESLFSFIPQKRWRTSHQNYQRAWFWRGKRRTSWHAPLVRFYRTREAFYKAIRWPFTYWPRWTRVELWAARRLAILMRRHFGWSK